MQKRRIMLAGGGTGGHIFPLIPVIRELKKRDVEVAFIGPEELSLDVLRNEDIDVHTIVSAGKFRRYASPKTLLEIVRTPVAIIQSLFILNKFKPHVIMGKGGYGTGAPVIAARILSIPIVLHESDTIPGLANRFLSRFARHILLGFKEAREYFPDKEMSVVGNPVRTEYRGMKKSEARQVLDLESERSTIFVMGGSQGAHSVNNLLLEALPSLLDRYAVIASVGENNIDAFKHINVKNAVIKPFVNEKELAAALTLADVFVSRAGSSGIFEAAAFAKPSILIPLSTSASGHQEVNARAYEKTEAAVVLDETKATGQTLTYAIESILTSPGVAEHMSTQAKKFATLDSAERIVDILIRYAHNPHKNIKT